MDSGEGVAVVGDLAGNEEGDVGGEERGEEGGERWVCWEREREEGDERGGVFGYGMRRGGGGGARVEVGEEGLVGGGGEEEWGEGCGGF